MDEVEEFDKELLSTTDEDDRLNFIRKYFFHGVPYVFKGREDDYFDFRSLISNHFDIGFHEVFIVGSGKFGFSYIKKTKFSYESDIDVVLVNESLFDYYYEKICNYQYEMDKYHKTISIDEKREYAEFMRYFIKGWMRPDLLPISFQMELLKDEWFNFFQSISHNKSKVGNYKVAGGLYKNYNYLEKYYVNSINAYYKKISIERGE